MKKITRVLITIIILGFVLLPEAFAADGAEPVINSGDTAFVLFSAALVLLMTPGLAFFYGGLVRKKNILSILIQCFILMCALALQWVIIGYSLSFSPDVGGGIIGGLGWLGLGGVGLTPSPDYASTIPHQLFMVFQGMFAIITPALIIGAFAERIKFSAFFIFMLIWATIIYDPLTHWVWGNGGWMGKLGVLDFAGGAVVHISAGVAALVMTLLIGKRKGFPREALPPHNLPFAVLGTGLLWFGWFGFNAGSSLAADGTAVNAFVTTNTAAAAGGLTWALIEWKKNGVPTTLGVVTGIVAGLASITPACGFVSVMSSILIGTMASIFCYIAVVIIKPKFGYDDTLDVFGVHGVSGIWGMIACGMLAQKSVNPGGADGLFFGNPGFFVTQLMAVGVTIVFVGILTFVLYKIIDATIGMRVSEQDEIQGLDLTQHQEVGYT